MPTAREQASLIEASRLLQEGLDLLAERSLEVNALLEDAREHALDITAEAEQRAAQIVAEAETRRTELDEQIAALQAEVASLREELVQLRTTRQGKGGRFLPAAAATPAVAATRVVAAPSEAAAEPRRVDLAPPPPETAPSEAVAEDTPHWGRRPATPPATRSRRPRWLPRWLPLLLLLLIGGLAVANMAGGEVLRGQAGAEPTAQDVLLPTPAPSAASASAILATTAVPTQALARAVLLAAPTVTSPTPALSATQPATRAPTATPLALALVVPTATLGPSPQVRATVVVPLAPVVEPLPSRPGETSRAGTLVAVYTSYVTYIVQPGDTINRLATRFGVSGDAIVRASGVNDPNLLVPGQALTIPRESGWLYRVQANETLDDIAARFGTSVEDLLAASMLSSAAVRPGELLFIPSRALPKIPQ